MKLVLLAVGKRHDPDIALAVEDYTARLRRYVPIDWRLIPAAQGRMSQAEVRATETKALLAALHPDDAVILLDERGRQLSSVELAQTVADAQQHAAGRLVFVIGGAYGVDADLTQRAQLVWSLSKLVFPHQLVRLILAEQLYRAQTILRGEPYHHE
jgi:23S rRNA (pseudouridine1915-N3)-methyltransferase